MEDNKKHIPFFRLDEIPDSKDNPEFWSLVNNPHLCQCILFLIVNEIRKYDPEALSNESCRTELAKLKALQELLDLPKGLSAKPEPPLSSDELPPH